MNNVLKSVLALSLSVALVFSISGLAVADEASLHTEGDPAYAEEVDSNSDVANEEDSFNTDEDAGIVFVEDILSAPDVVKEIDEYLTSTYGNQFLENQDAATAEAERILYSFPKSRTGEMMHPEYYGGMYIDTDGNLVTLIAGDSANAGEARLSRFANTRTEHVEFSYAELDKVWQTILNYSNEHWPNSECPVAQNIDAIGTDIIGNKVYVYLTDASSQQTELFRSTIIDHPALDFIQSSGQHIEDINDGDAISAVDYDIIDGGMETTSIHPLTTTGLRPGGWIIRSNNATQSMGYRVRRSGQDGFVTTMHGSPNLQNNDRFFINSVQTANEIGAVAFTSAQFDVVFVRLNQGRTMSQTNGNANVTVSSTVFQNPLAGHVVMRVSEGAHTPTVSAGYIQSTNHTYWSPSHQRNITTIRADYSGAAGDSGGVVVHWRSPNYEIAGIHIGRDNQSGGYGHSVFAHAVRVNSALSVTPH